MSRLPFRAEAIDASTDLLNHYADGGFFFEHDGGGVATRGVALQTRVPAGPDQVLRAAREAERLLERVEWSGAQPPVVVTALPFDSSSPATLVVPRVAVVHRSDGSVWRLTAGEPETASASERGTAPQIRRFRQPSPPLRITPIPEPAAYVDAVAVARKRILAGELDKVVLARMLMVRASNAFDRRALIARLRASEPHAYVFGVRGFVGASPELLVARRGSAVLSNPLAGTTARRAEPAADEAAARRLLGSDKERREHGYVVDAVRSGLAEVCSSLEAPRAPVLLPTTKVWHLSTDVRGTLARDENVLALAARLHPTPAVCGTPPDVAMRLIAELERIDRTYYAGVVAWMDARGDGECAVALRCAEVQGNIALVFAGAGVVGASDPEAELEETDAKFDLMLDALGYRRA